MAPKPKLSEDERKELVDLVKTQIFLYNCGEMETLLNNQELGEIYNVSSAIIKYNLKLLPLEYRKYRKKIIFIEHTKKYFSQSENRDKVSKRMKEHFSQQENRDKVSKRAIKFNSKSDIKKKHSETMTKLNLDTNFQEKRKKGYDKMIVDPKSKLNRIYTAINLNLNLRRKSYFVDNRFYASSQQEGVVALLLEEYIIGKNNLKEGINFQVRNKEINNGGIDFLIENEFLEWHPIILYKQHEKQNSKNRGDIPSRQEYESYKKVLSQLEQEEKKEFEEQYKKVLAINYRNKRQESVDNSGYKGLEVKLATNEQELYNFISQFNSNLPSYEDFKREFNQKIKYVKQFKVNKEIKAA